MRKILISLILMIGFSLGGWMVRGVAASTPNISVRIEQPSTPTNKNSFTVTFVVLDRLGRPMTAECLKSGPNDGGSYSQFGSDISLLSGGNTGNCSIDGSVVNTEGTYSFEVRVSASGPAETEVSAPVSAQYLAGGPGTPNSYSKDHPSSCQYVIKFHTADDSGKTSSVKVYRSDSLSFSVDGSTQVGTVWIGSNMDGSFTDSVPDCNKTWYYAIRAFDGAGDGSAVVGDNQTTTIEGSPAPTTAAIPVAGGASGIAGSTEGETGTSGAILGAEASPTPGALAGSGTFGKGILAGLPSVFSSKKLWVAILTLVALGALGVYLKRRSE